MKFIQQQFKRACLETRRTRADMSHHPLNDAENDQKTWEPQLMNKGLVPRGTQEDEP